MTVATKKISQTQLVLNHLISHGYITEVIARNYGVRRLASRMNELKNEGVGFTSEPRTDDSGVRYAYYSMSVIDRNFERARRDEHGQSWSDITSLKAA
jgi:Helix-turn-helix domain